MELSHTGRSFTRGTPANLMAENRLILKPVKSKSKLWCWWCTTIVVVLKEVQSGKFCALLKCVVDVILFHS